MEDLSRRFGAGAYDTEQAFAEHFGISYQEFMIAVGSLGEQDLDRYGKTYEANPEAAVLWALRVCKERGILQED